LSTLDLNAGTAATLQVRVAEGGRIDGRVAGAKRARGLVVVLTGLQGETEWVTNVTPTEDGCFQFQGLAPGKYSVVVRPLNSALDWDDAAQNMQEVQVQGGRAIAVTLEAPAEEPASGDRRN
jgi:predicted phage tail protein